MLYILYAYKARSRTFLTAVLTVIVAMSAVPLNIARAEYPERQITVIVPFAAGGGTDIAARLISKPLAEALGKPVIVENRAGAGGNIGIAAAARAAPDGYTLLLSSSAFVVNPSLYAKKAYDPFKDFLYVMVIGASPNVIVVPSSSDVKALAELIAKAKANPGKMNWTSPGVGTTPYLAGELLKLRTQINMLHIPYSGAGPATQAGLAAQVDMLTANLGSVAPHIESGALRALAQTGKERWPELRKVPTLAELGINDAESDTFQAIYAPAGTPQQIIDRLVKELTEILKRSEIRELFLKTGLGVLADGPDVLRARVTREVPMYKEIIDKAGLKIE
jgi:tripartite-type tricarboxylate transporter receptor subunit TctC